MSENLPVATPDFKPVSMSTNREIRSRFDEELANNPATVDLLIALAASEKDVSNGTQATTGFIETVFNRATINNNSIYEIISNKNYYSSYNYGGVNRVANNANSLTTDQKNQYRTIIQNVQNGSNVTNGATHNELNKPIKNKNGEFYNPFDRFKGEARRYVDIAGEAYYIKNGESEVGLTAGPETANGENLAPPLASGDSIASDGSTTSDGSGETVNEEVVPNPYPQPATDTYNPVGGGNAGGPRGFFSIPQAGSQVWLFFHGGDPNRPVYFASNIDPEGWKSFLQASSPPKKVNNSRFNYGSSQKHTFIESDGISGHGFSIFGSKHIEKYDDSVTAKDNSHAEFQSGASTVRLENSNATVKSQGNVTTVAGNYKVDNAHATLAYTGAGGSNSHNDGEAKSTSGAVSGDGLAAAKSTQESLDKVSKAQTDAIEKTTGSEVECPICSQKYATDNTDFVQRSLRTLENLSNYLPWNCWNWPVTQFFLEYMVIPVLEEVDGLTASGGKGCGACKNGRIKSPKEKLDAGNKAAAAELKNQQSNIDEQSKKRPIVTQVEVKDTDWYVKAGSVTNNVPAYKSMGQQNPIPTGSKKAVKGNILVATSENAADIVSHLQPLKSIGSITLDSANNIDLIAGSPGMNFKTTGKLQLAAGGVEILGSDGPVTIGSNNVTNISGRTVHIMDSQDGGVRISAKNTNIGGALHVDGDIGLKGTLTMDGAVAAKHLIMPSMRSESTMSSGPKAVTNGATWAAQAVAQDEFDKVKNLLMRDLKPGLALTPSQITTLVTETYNSIMLAATVEPTPIGFTVCCTCGIVPVIGFTHNHGKTSEDHSHFVTLPKGNYYNDSESWHQARPNPATVPTPAPAYGDGQSPGPRSLGGCGGGGAGFTDGLDDSAASQYIDYRNAQYGLPPNTTDYSKVVPNNPNYYDYDGEFKKDPTFNPEYKCL